METSTKEEYKRVANAFSPDNYIVANAHRAFKLVGSKMEKRDAGVFAAYYPDAAGVDADREARIAACKRMQGDDWFIKLLAGTKILAGHNIKFDVLYALGNPNSNREANRKAWMKWVAEGGLVWDTQLGEYLLKGQAQEAHMLDLGTTAIEHGGNAKLDEVKLMWEQGVDTIDIPRDKLMDYLVGFETNGEWEHGDIGNTELIFRSQYLIANKRGQLRSIFMNMGALIYTIECELNGMFVNQTLAKELAKEVEDELAAKLVEVNSYIPADLPFEFNWNSRFHKSALIFGGKVKYKAPAPVLDDEGNLQYYQKKETHYVLEDGTTASFEDVEKHGLVVATYAGGKNKGEPKTKQVTVPDKERGPKTRIEDHFYTFEGYTKGDKKWESSEPGVYSTAGDVIEALGNRGIPFLDAMARVQALTKDLGTYFIRYDEKKKAHVGMLTLVQLDSIVHHMLNHTNTVTGRLSSSNPNLQNLSKGQKSRVKEVFESRWGEDGVIIQSDFSSLEVYVQAILTKAEKLIEDLKSGKDMHCVRLAAKEGKTYEEVYELCKVIADPEWDYKRTGAKVFSFQRAYGAGNKTIAESTGMPLEEVEALAQAEDERYHEVPAYFEKKTEEIKASREPAGIWLKHPANGADVQLGVGHSRTPGGKLYTYKETLAPDFLVKRGILRNFMPTEIKNYEVQGEGGEIAKAGMWLTVRAFYTYENFKMLALLVNQVHDAEYADAHKDVAVKAAALLHACMSEASNFFSWFLQWSIPLPVPTDTVWGPNMGTENKIDDPEFEAIVAKARPWLRKQFMNGYEPTFTH
ncbi:DNA polymerase A family protein [Burkholderia sp. MSMB2042]|nr:DNA polymerase A family protein [Burkholderia savannae]KVG39859.1 DNA polymerase A family protein [Burkholderia sp. MSMB0265]KVG85760.1 DNA polymerase A family protein [Burkholderia sp. MSMB2040]KVG92255.1 DNA polymerase A family protein [Burkholderia sp. MSMB2041]KVG95697.1 DNA polymerase A family protein [Burkholderia sp. MSMB2042]